MQILDGKLLSNKIKNEVKLESDSYKVTPILAVISISSDKIRNLHLDNIKKACEYCDISIMNFNYTEDAEEKTIIKKIKELNKDKNVNAILLNLLENKKTDLIINAISPDKDIDSLTDISKGKIINNTHIFTPCISKSIIELFDYNKVDLENKNIVIVDDNVFFEQSLITKFIYKKSSVTICNSKNNNLKDYTKKADILIVSANKKYFIDKTMIKKDSIIIDLGINLIDNNIYGDINPNVENNISYFATLYNEIYEIYVSMLLKNTMIAYKRQNEIK